jgi:CHAT domain-containing protein
MNRHLSPRARYNIPAIRKLLRAAFNDEDLSIFCYNYFEEVYQNFAIGMTLSWKGQLLIEHCERNNLLPRLLDRIRQSNVVQFKKYEDEIRNPGQPEDLGIIEDFANTAYDLAQKKGYNTTAIECLEAGLTYGSNCAVPTEDAEDRYKAAQIREALDAAKSGDRHIPFESLVPGTLFLHGIVKAAANAPLVYLVTTNKGSLAFIVLPDCTSLGDTQRHRLDDFTPVDPGPSSETRVQVGVGVVRMDGFTSDDLKDLLVEADALRHTTGGYLWAKSAGTDTMKRVLDAVSETLGKRLIERLAHCLRELGFDRLTFIPFGQLSVLPLHAARYEGETGPCYLLDEFEVTYAPSARILSRTRNRVAQAEGRRDKLLSVGSEINAFSQDEAQAVARIAAASPSPATQIVLGPAVTPQLLLAQAANARYLHLACNVVVDGYSPLESKMVLSQDTTVNLDDLVSAGRLEGAQLVTISAVQPPRIDADQCPEANKLLSASFLEAQATSVVSNLWLANDLSTSLLMKQFYTYHFQDGLTPAAALRRAQRWLREEVTAGAAAEVCHRRVESLYTQRAPALAQAIDDWTYYDRLPADSHPFAHPVYWAAFTISGA